MSTPQPAPRSTPSTASPRRFPLTTRAPAWPGCAAKPTPGCSATGSAPAPPSWTAAWKQPAKTAPTSGPASCSRPSCPAASQPHDRIDIVAIPRLPAIEPAGTPRPPLPAPGALRRGRGAAGECQARAPLPMIGMRPPQFAVRAFIGTCHHLARASVRTSRAIILRRLRIGDSEVMADAICSCVNSGAGSTCSGMAKRRGTFQQSQRVAVNEVNAMRPGIPKRPLFRVAALPKVRPRTVGVRETHRRTSDCQCHGKPLQHRGCANPGITAVIKLKGRPQAPGQHMPAAQHQTRQSLPGPAPRLRAPANRGPASQPSRTRNEIPSGIARCGDRGGGGSCIDGWQ